MDDSQSFLVGSSEVMQRLRSQVETIAKTDARVLIHGESGSGKERIAQELHRLSSRSDKPLVIVNCGAIPEALFESEMFGHERGSFTGAVAQRLGVFERANGGILFLDEVGEIPLSMQAKLLRVLEAGTFTRVGGTKEIAVDVRVISATNKNLRAEADRGKWRHDLYHRLNILPIHSPSLAARISDVPELVQHFLTRLDRSNLILEEATMSRLLSYSFPGNCRELHNICMRLCVLCEGDVVTNELLQHVMAMDMQTTVETVSQKPTKVYKRTEEQRKNMSIAAKARWAKLKEGVQT